MENSINQLYTLFVFILSGAVIGILFDLFRILRKSFKTPDNIYRRYFILDTNRVIFIVYNI